MPAAANGSMASDAKGVEERNSAGRLGQMLSVRLKRSAEKCALCGLRRRRLAVR